MLEYDLMDGPTPFIYDLQVIGKGEGLSLVTNKETAERIEEAMVAPNPKLIEALRGKLNLPEYIPPTLERKWGFGEIIESVEGEGGTRFWKCAWPSSADSREQGYSLSAATVNSLGLLLRYLDFAEKPAETPKKQLTHLGCDTVLGKRAMTITIGSSMLPWIRLQPDHSRCLRAEETMKLCYENLTSRRTFEADFRATFRTSQSLYLTCWGDACTMSAGQKTPGKAGYQLWPHNLDSPDQILTFATAIAVLNEEARKAGY